MAKLKPYKYFVKFCKYSYWVMFMKRRNIVRLVSFLSAVIVALSGVIIKSYQKNRSLSLQISNNYSKSMNDFSASLNNIALLLKKTSYATTAGQLSRYAAELLTEAEITKTAIAQLPSASHLDSLNRFLSQVGNYAFAVSLKLHGGEQLPHDFASNIIKLSDTAQKISQIVSTAQINYDNPDYWSEEIDQQIDQNVDESLSVSLQEIEGEFDDYPTLLYDGPYSDHITQKEPTMLQDKTPVSQTEALETACKFLDVSSADLKFADEQHGKIEAYRFGNDGTDITVSKVGGYVMYMRKNRQIENSKISYKQAISAAKKFLEEHSLNNFSESYYFIDEGVCVINFAFVDGETICYTDLIKVGVAMDTGEVMLYESMGYLSNHQDRAFLSAEYTPEQASENVSEYLKILKTSIALIPTRKGNEARCYEFSCIDGETEVLVYVNVATLEVEELFILLKSDGGTLVK
ncbi:MAG: hypothetical protein E7542_04570 [Ruminococcaceae bacterium]|nr:hypothetical protein [Oscillospiraceae bacterium]